VLYGTTRKFLQIFGLKSLKDLPQVEELQSPEKRTTEAQRAQREETPREE
jgi:chromosome segregation and condensation protein ScpB